MKKNKVKKTIWAAVLILAMTVTLFSGSTMSVAAAGGAVWVDPVNGSDSNDGSNETSAFKTIQAAKTKAAELSADSDVTVYLKGGTYSVTEAISFDAADSGKNGNTITYQAAPGEIPVISGGTEIGGWMLHDSENNIYAASIPESLQNARQFYVDGKRQTRSATEESPTDWEVLGSGGYISPAVNDPNTNEYVIIDLGEEKTVSMITLYPNDEVDAEGNAAGFPKDFTIETSVDGENFEVQHTENDYVAPAAGSAVEFSFEAVDARYVKLNVTKLGTSDRLNPGKYKLSLSEIETGTSSGEIRDEDLNLSVAQQIDLNNNILTADRVMLLGYCSGEGYVNETVYNMGWSMENLVDGNAGTNVSAQGFQ